MKWNYDECTHVVNYTPQLATYDADVQNQQISLCVLILVSIFFAGHTCLIVFLREQISVACRILALSAEALTDMPYLVFYPIGQAIVVLLYFVLFCGIAVLLSSAGTFTKDYQYGNAVMTYEDEANQLFAFWLFGAFWNVAFIEAIGFMVISFCCCMWFFAPRPEEAEPDSTEREMPDNVLTKAIKMTLGHHLGTLATGSLIIAIVRMMRVALEYIESKSKEMGLEEEPWFQYVICILRCLLWCLEKCARWMCKKVYIETCIHGTWFCGSLCQVIVALFNMIDYISVLEYISLLMLFFGKLAIGLGTAVIGGYILGTRELSSIIFPTVVVMCMGFAVAAMFIEVYEMCLDTILLCFCESKLAGPDSGICIPSSLEQFMSEDYDGGGTVKGADPADAELGLSEDLLAEMHEKFDRYDLDSSGTINSEEELLQLMTNLYFTLSSKGIETVTPEEISSRVKSAGDMEKNNWKFGAWGAWCKQKFPEIAAYGNKKEE